MREDRSKQETTDRPETEMIQSVLQQQVDVIACYDKSLESAPEKIFEENKKKYRQIHEDLAYHAKARGADANVTADLKGKALMGLAKAESSVSKASFNALILAEKSFQAALSSAESSYVRPAVHAVFLKAQQVCAANIQALESAKN